jgi:hypothetical protein
VFFDTDGYRLDGRTFLGRTWSMVNSPAYHEDAKGTKATKP